MLDEHPRFNGKSVISSLHDLMRSLPTYRNGYQNWIILIRLIKSYTRSHAEFHPLL